MADWHPIMNLVEDSPGVFRLVAQYDRCYGIIRMVKRGTEVGYRATTCAETAERIELVGYYRKLKSAAMAVHQRDLRSGAPQGFAPDPWNTGAVGPPTV